MTARIAAMLSARSPKLAALQTAAGLPIGSTTNRGVLPSRTQSVVLAMRRLPMWRSRDCVRSVGRAQPVVRRCEHLKRDRPAQLAPASSTPKEEHKNVISKRKTFPLDRVRGRSLGRPRRPHPARRRRPRFPRRAGACGQLRHLAGLRHPEGRPERRHQRPFQPARVRDRRPCPLAGRRQQRLRRPGALCQRLRHEHARLPLGAEARAARPGQPPHAHRRR